MMLKRAPSLTEQTKSHLKQLILADEFADGRIPPETTLAEELGVSRTTIRDALSRLEQEGVISRKQGAGTFVNRPGLQIKSRLDEIWSYEGVLRAHGYTPSTRILDVSTIGADEETAVALDIAPGAELLVVKKLFLADSEPVILAHNHIPLGQIAAPYEEADLLLPVYVFLSGYGRQPLSYYLSDIIPVVATADLAATLHIPSQTPLLSLSEIGYSDDNQPILKSTSWFRDDLLRLRLIRRSVQ